MEIELREIAEATGAHMWRDGSFESLGFLDGYGGRRLTVLYDPSFIAATKADPSISAVLTTEVIAPQLPRHLGIATCSDPMQHFVAAHFLLKSRDGFYWRSFASRIDRTAIIHPSAHVDPKDVEIGAGVVVGPGAIILARSILDEDVAIGPGTVIGAEGLQLYSVEGSRRQLPHAGGVRLHRGVVVLANSTIDCALFNGCTEIGQNTKIDGHVYIGHNVAVGRDGMITAGAVIGGSSRIGDRVRIGLNATIANGLSIGDDAFVPMAEMVARDVPAGMAITRNTIMPADRLSRIVSGIRDHQRHKEGRES